MRRDILYVWRRDFRQSHVMNATRRFTSTTSGRWMKLWLWLDRVNRENAFGVVVTMLKTKKHANICSGIFSHMYPKTHTHTQSTYHSETIAKHTTHYIWTVSLTDQTHVDGLTLDLSMYDYSSSSYTVAWVMMLLRIILSHRCLFLNLIYIFSCFSTGFTEKKAFTFRLTNRKLI